MESSHPTRALAQCYLDELQDALLALRSGRRPWPESVVWPAGLDRSVALSLPLTVRTRNCLCATGLDSGDEQLTAAQLLRIDNFGIKSLKDLLFCSETFLLDCRHRSRDVLRADSTDESGGEGTGRPVLDQSVELNSPCSTDTEPQDQGDAIWRHIQQALKPLLAVMAETGIAARLSDVLHPRLLDAATCLGARDDLRGIRLDEAVVGERGLAGQMLERLEQLETGLAERQIAILERRILERRTTTLESLGTELGITRERVRQLQVKLERKLRRALGEELRLLAKLVGKDLDAIVRKDDMTRRMAEILPAAQGLAGKMIRVRLLEAMGYEFDEGMAIHASVKAKIPEIRALTTSSADDEGLVEEKAFIEWIRNHDPRWIEHWDWLRQRCRLHRMHGYIAVRDSAKAKAKSALLSIGRPATKGEIGRLCGLTEARVGGAFSNIDSVVRADSKRWGLREWVDDEYDGIVGEIIQRIKEDGGTTTTKRLMDEIPSTFNVSPSSVRAYMQTALFEIQGSTIRIADTSRLRLRHLDDVIHGRDANGKPYWTFDAEERHLRGFSVLGVPVEFVNAIGCEPDSRLMVDIENIENTQRLSIRWPLASTTGGSFGHLAQPLYALDLRPGDRVRVTIEAPGRVTLAHHEHEARDHSDNDVAAIVERMRARRRAL